MLKTATWQYMDTTGTVDDGEVGGGGNALEGGGCMREGDPLRRGVMMVS